MNEIFFKIQSRVTGRYSINVFYFQGKIGCLDKFREKVKTANLGGSNFLLVDAI